MCDTFHNVHYFKQTYSGHQSEKKDLKTIQLLFLT